MIIKTISTVDGVNVVDFGNTVNKYYWFKNLGDSTIYVANKEDFKAGDDGVSELTAKGAITNIEASDGKVYILGAGKVEIHNTDSKLSPFKSAPVAGSGGGEDSKVIRHYIYLNGEELNGHTITPYAYYSSDITKDKKCIILNSAGNVFIESELIEKGNFKRVGVRLCTVPWSGSGWYACRIGISNTLGYASGWATEQKYPAGNFKYILCTPDQNKLNAIDEFYIDIPDTYSEFCAIVQICYRITYVGAIWLE